MGAGEGVSRIITLLSDFGTADSYVGEVRGTLLSLAPDATLVDLTHDIAPGDVSWSPPSGSTFFSRSIRPSSKVLTCAKATRSRKGRF